MVDLAGAYADARQRFRELLAGLDAAALAVRVPACPAWTVHDVLAHVTGVAADAASGTYFPGAADAWNDIRLAAARDEWTARQVRSRRNRPVDALVAEWACSAATLEPMLAGTVPPPPGSPAWLLPAPVANLAVHLHDVRGALRLPRGPGRPRDQTRPADLRPLARPAAGPDPVPGPAAADRGPGVGGGLRAASRGPGR
jgi:uncharacterized protein (TIGR03083 family)